MKTIIVSEPGGPEVLQVVERPTPRPGVGELLVDISVIGVNYFDTGIRQHRVAEVPGMEGVGVVAEVGEGVEDFAVGDRVGWLTIEDHGSYAEQRTVSQEYVVALPAAISDEIAAALILQGLSADHFATASHSVQPGEIALVHAAAGGVGLMLTQIIKARGGTVIALVSRPEKVDIATRAGADHVLVSSGAAFVDEVMDLTDGEGVHVVFDGAGASTFAASQSVLRTHGTMVYYGPLIGDVPTVVVNEIPRSTKLTYGALNDYVRTPDELRTRLTALFSLVEQGRLRAEIGHRYPLSEAAQAHRDIESRGTTGKLLLIP